MTKKFKKTTLSLTASAVLVGNAFALDPAITNFGYVGGNSSISIFNTTNPSQVKTITGISNASATAVDPSGKYFYSTYYDGGSGQGGINRFNIYTGLILDSNIATGSMPQSIALNSDGSKTYISHAGQSRISIIETDTNNVTSINTPATREITLTPDNSKALVAVFGENRISVIDSTTHNEIATINVGTNPVGVAISPDGLKAYVSNSGDNTISVINIATNSVTNTLNVGTNPQSIIVSNDGSTVYVANQDSDSISIIDTTTNTVTQTINGIDTAFGLSISPDDTMLYVKSNDTNKLFTIRISDYNITTYTEYTSSTTFANSLSISPNLLTGTLEASSSAELETKGFANYVNFAGGTLKATGSFTLSKPVYLHDEFNLEWDDSSTFTTVAGGTVDTNGYDVEFSGEVSGVGGLTKTGTGKLTVSGANSYTGDTVVDAGTLEFTGNRTLGVFEVKENAFLNVTGDLTLSNSSIYKLHANSLGESGKVAVTGTANLDGTVQVKADSSGTWNETTDYEILSATAVNGTFDSVSSDLAFLDPTLSYEANKVNLTLTRNSTTYSTVANNSVSQSVGSVLDNVTSPNADMQNLITTLNGMNNTQAQTALTQLAGTPLASTATSIPTAIQSSFSSGIASRFASLRSDSLGLGGLAFVDAGDMHNTYKMLKEEGLANENGLIVPKDEYFSMWSRVIGSKTKTNSDGIRASSDVLTKGLQIGVDKNSEDLVFGLSYAYLSSDTSFSNNEAASDTNSHILGLYADKSIGAWGIKPTLSLSKNSTDANRDTPTGTASSDTNSYGLNFDFDVSNDLLIEPSLLAGVAYLKQNGYSESGAGGSNLSIKSYSATTYTLGTGVKATKLFKENDKVLGSLELSLSYKREFGDTNKPLSASFSAAPSAGSFSINGVETGKNSFNANVLGIYNVDKKVELFASLGGYTKSKQDNYTGILGIKYKY
jgi:autotransporter-associated beta strand protein/YVTN family beta-propeller protein